MNKAEQKKEQILKAHRKDKLLKIHTFLHLFSSGSIDIHPYSLYNKCTK